MIIQGGTVATPMPYPLPKDGSEAMTGNLAMGGNKITSLGTPTEDLDAVTKEYVDDTFIEMHQLWSNPNLGTTFSEKTILNNGELVGYNVVIILFVFGIISGTANNQRLPAFICNVGASTGGWECGINPTNNKIVGRVITSVKSDSGIVFGSGYNSGTVDNKVCLPYRVYGIKGVINKEKD